MRVAFLIFTNIRSRPPDLSSLDSYIVLLTLQVIQVVFLLTSFCSAYNFQTKSLECLLFVWFLSKQCI